MSTLHIITQSNDPLALEAAAHESGTATILLLQDGVYLGVESGRVFAGADDVRARGLECGYPLVDDEGVIDLVIGHDRVICWH